MTAVALPTPRAIPRGVLRLQLELRWNDSVVVSRNFEHGVWAGPTKYHPFPIEGFGCTEGFVLASREGDVFTVQAPGQRAVRLGEGMRCSFGDGQLTLHAWVTREHQAVSLAWFWLYYGGLGLLTLWLLLRWFGIALAFLLYLLPHHPPAPLVVAKTLEPQRPVKVLPFVPEVKPPPLPEKTSDSLKQLLDGKRWTETFKDAAKKSAAREREQQKKKVAKEVAVFGMIGLLSAKPDHAYAVLGSLQGADLNQLVGEEGGVVGGAIGSTYGSGGLGLRGTGTGLGTLGGVGRLSLEHNAAEEKARALAKAAGPRCFGEAEGRVLMRVAISPDGDASGTPLTTNAPSSVVDCLKSEIRGWKLPATGETGRVTLAFRATP